LLLASLATVIITAASRDRRAMAFLPFGSLPILA
jgi:hypothetical protein